MDIYYTSERNAQILISLLKKHNIRNIIISPGSTNICFTASVQHDSYFNLYSSVDERSAAYMACGLAAETKEPVVISCTGATASRNYMPGLTEAFYRNLPVLAITSTQPRERVGQNIPQVLDRSSKPNDILKSSFYIETIYNKEKEWAAINLINHALIDLRKNGGGPVHIDLETTYSPDFSVKELPDVPMVEFYSNTEIIPDINQDKVAVFVGAHLKWEQKQIELLEKFCELYNGVVLCDHTSNYWGKYRVLPNLMSVQRANRSACLKIDFLIHIGEMSGAYMQIEPNIVWRVSPDGRHKDTFKHLRMLVQSDEEAFFEEMIRRGKSAKRTTYYQEWKTECEAIEKKLPELPFSNAWIASQSSLMIPKGSTVHFGILNSLRTWNYFQLNEGVLGFCNTGGFGIDGCVSSMIGASFADKNKLFFGIVGDLAFFYDLNAIGNRDIGANIRLIVVNNGKGNEFRNYGNWCAPIGEYADEFICAARHFGNKSSNLLKHYAEDLGFDYFCASNKDEFKEVKDKFFSADKKDKPILLEVFTTTEDESRALELIINACGGVASSAKDMAKSVLGESGVHVLKRILGRG